MLCDSNLGTCDLKLGVLTVRPCSSYYNYRSHASDCHSAAGDLAVLHTAFLLTLDFVPATHK